MWLEQLLLEFGDDLDLKFGHTTFQGIFYIECDDYQGMLILAEHGSMEECAREAYMSLLESRLKGEYKCG